MKQTSIAKVLIISTMIFAKETLKAQWSGTNPISTLSNVGIGQISPNAKLEVKSIPFGFLGTLGGGICATIIPHIRISGNTFTKMYPDFPNPNNCPFGTFNANITGDYNWDIFGGEDGSTRLDFKLFKNGVSVYTPLSILDFSVSVNNILNVGNYITSHGIKSNGINSFSENFTVTTSNFSVNNSGTTVIGNLKATYHPDAKLHVAGKVAAQHFVVTKPSNWSDKVFQKGYKLLSLTETEEFIEKNNHLPDVPSEADVMEKGYDTNEMDAILLQKIEELTLHVIEIKKENAALKKEISNFKKQ